MVQQPLFKKLHGIGDEAESHGIDQSIDSIEYMLDKKMNISKTTFEQARIKGVVLHKSGCQILQRLE